MQPQRRLQQHQQPPRNAEKGPPSSAMMSPQSPKLDPSVLEARAQDRRTGCPPQTAGSGERGGEAAGSEDRDRPRTPPMAAQPTARKFSPAGWRGSGVGGVDVNVLSRPEKRRNRSECRGAAAGGSSSRNFCIALTTRTSSLTWSDDTNSSEDGQKDAGSKVSSLTSDDGQKDDSNSSDDSQKDDSNSSDDSQKDESNSSDDGQKDESNSSNDGQKGDRDAALKPPSSVFNRTKSSALTWEDGITTSAEGTSSGEDVQKARRTGEAENDALPNEEDTWKSPSHRWTERERAKERKQESGAPSGRLEKRRKKAGFKQELGLSSDSSRNFCISLTSRTSSLTWEGNGTTLFDDGQKDGTNSSEDGQAPGSKVSSLSSGDDRRVRIDAGARAKAAGANSSSATLEEGDTSTLASSSTYSSMSSKRPRTFPEQLIDMLNEEACVGTSDAISWLPDGKSFAIRHPDRLTKEVLPKYFPRSKYDSFVRKLYRWGFRKTDVPEDEGITFYHKCFRRSDRWLCRKMRSIVAPRKKKEAKEAPVTGCSGGGGAGTATVAVNTAVATPASMPSHAGMPVPLLPNGVVVTNPAAAAPTVSTVPVGLSPPAPPGGVAALAVANPTIVNPAVANPAVANPPAGAPAPVLLNPGSVLPGVSAVVPPPPPPPPAQPNLMTAGVAPQQQQQIQLVEAILHAVGNTLRTQQQQAELVETIRRAVEEQQQRTQQPQQQPPQPMQTQQQLQQPQQIQTQQQQLQTHPQQTTELVEMIQSALQVQQRSQQQSELAETLRQSYVLNAQRRFQAEQAAAAAQAQAAAATNVAMLRALYPHLFQ